MKVYALALVAALGLLAVNKFAWSEPPIAEDFAVQVSLKLSTEEYDPHGPTGTLSCWIRNSCSGSRSKNF